MKRTVLVFILVLVYQAIVIAQCPTIISLRTPKGGEIFKPGDTIKLDIALIASSNDIFVGNLVLSFSFNNGDDWILQDTIFQDSSFFINPNDTSTYDNLNEWLDTSTFVTIRHNFICPNIISDSCLILLQPTHLGCLGGTQEVFSISNSSSSFEPPQTRSDVVHLFPNPIRSGAQLRVKVSPTFEIDQIQVLSISGRIMGIYQKSENTIELGDMAIGTYFVRLIKDNQTVGIKKLQVF